MSSIGFTIMALWGILKINLLGFMKIVYNNFYSQKKTKNGYPHQTYSLYGERVIVDHPAIILPSRYQSFSDIKSPCLPVAILILPVPGRPG
jgi:hypothetical protein